MIHYQYLCYRIGAGDGFRFVEEPGHATHPFRLLVAHTEGEGDARRATAQIELQFSLGQLRALAAQVNGLLACEDEVAYNVGEPPTEQSS